MTQHHTSSFKKAAVLTGLTVLVGGAEISTADAATTTPAETQSIGTIGPNTDINFLNFNQFNDALGTLQGVNFSLNSFLDIFEFISFQASVSVNSNPLFSQSANGPFIAGPQTVASDPFFRGAGTFPVLLVLGTDCHEGSCGGEGWTGTLSVSFTYEENANAVPLPAALPLFAAGAAGLGVLGWRNRRKQKVKKA
jgi:hypothetical protein